MKKAILLLLALTILFTTVTPISAADIVDPVFCLAFEQLDGGHLYNFASNSYEILTNNISSTEGARGVGAVIAKKGYITSPENKIGNMLTGANGITVSAYIKNGDVADGDIVTVYYNEDKAGLKLIKKGSCLTVAVSSDKNEVLKSASFDTKESFNDWTNIAVSIDFIANKVSFYVNGSNKATASVDFMSDSYCHYGAFLPDNIGTAQMYIDEFKIYPKALNDSEVEAAVNDDKNEPEEPGYVDILADNLVAHYAFDEGEGMETKTTGMVEATGVAQNEHFNWIPGVKGTALQFHQSYPNYFDFGHTVSDALVGAKGLTVTGWILMHKEQGSGYKSVFYTLYSNTGKVLYRLQATGGYVILNPLRSEPTAPATGLNYKDPNAFTFGDWHFFTMTTDLIQNEIHFYLDGKELTAMQNGGSPKANFTTTEFSVAEDRPNDTIGSDPYGTIEKMTINGALDEFKVYNRSITKEEAEYLYVENKNGDWMSQDADNFETLKGYSNNGVFMALNHNEVITAERRKRIDWNDFNATPVLKGTTTMVPVKLLTEYLGATAEVDLEAKTAKVGNLVFTADSLEYTMSGAKKTLNDAPFIKGTTMYVPLRVVTQMLGKSIYYHDSGVLAVGDAATVKAFSKDEDYVEWFHGALTKLHYVQQTADHYGTRQVVRYEPNLKLWHSSPAVLELEDGTLLYSHDTAGRGSTVWRSDDNGETWYETFYTDMPVYANLFENKGSVYMMGVARNPFGLGVVPVLFRTDDKGLTWTEPKDNKTGLMVEDDGSCLVKPAHGAPVPIVKHNGRIYRAIDSSGNGWRDCKVYMMSADENSDLLDRKSWTISNPIHLKDYYDKFPEYFGDDYQYSDAGICEANAVLGPNGKMYILARFNSAPELEWAGMCRLEDDGTLVFDRIVRFPGGMTKFLVRYDEVSQKWYALANPNTDPDYPCERICLCLLVSDDFYNWRIAETLLVPDWLDNWQNYLWKNGFQYPDFYFDGDDIVYAVREANEGAYNFHNGNYCTLYRLKNFRDYADRDITQQHFDVVYERMMGR